MPSFGRFFEFCQPITRSDGALGVPKLELDSVVVKRPVFTVKRVGDLVEVSSGCDSPNKLRVAHKQHPSSIKGDRPRLIGGCFDKFDNRYFPSWVIVATSSHRATYVVEQHLTHN